MKCRYQLLGGGWGGWWVYKAQKMDSRKLFHKVHKIKCLDKVHTMEMKMLRWRLGLGATSACIFDHHSVTS